MTSQRQVWALYARVSKAEDQTTLNQVPQLFAWGESRGVPYEMHQEAITSRKTRPVKEELLRRLRTGELAGVCFVSLSRWGRSLDELAREIREFHESKWGMVSLKEGFNLDTAAGRAMAGMLATFAEFERELIHERTMAGLERARAQGKRLGARPGNQNARKHPKPTPPANPAQVSPIGPEPNQSVVRLAGVVREAALATGLLGKKEAV